MKIITNLSPCEVSERARSSAIIIAEQALRQKASTTSSGKKVIDVEEIDVRVDRLNTLTVNWKGCFLNQEDELIEESGKEVYSSRNY